MPRASMALVALLLCATKAVAGSPVGGRCGDAVGLVCEAGLDCKFPGGRTDRIGACVTRPVGCSHELEPVCGRNGVTYPNACVLRSARVGLAHPGRC